MRRRLLTIALVAGFAWAIVALSGRPAVSREAAGIALGIALIIGSLTGTVFEDLGLPRVTGYLVFGLVAGPSVLSTITRPIARELQFVNGVAVALIAFTAGLQLNLARLRPRLASVATIGGVTMLVTWAALTGVTYVVWPWIPIAPALTGLARLTVVSLLAAVLASCSPTVTIAVIAETRARGPLADLSLAVVVLADLVVVALFSVSMEGARVLLTSDAAGAAYLARFGWEIVGSVAFGAIVGSGFALYVRYVGRDVTLVLLGACALIGGLGGELHFQPLLAAIAAGAVVQNTSMAAGDALRDAIEGGAQPILIIFFAAAGASLHLDVLATIGVVAVGLSAVRLAVVRAGTRLGARLAGAESPESRLLWRALVSKSGMTLALTVLVAAAFPDWGGRLETLVVAVLALHELAGPILFRAALVQAREVERATGGLVVVSNREPWLHEFAPDGSIRVRSTPGGVSVALDALMRERGGVWIAHGAGNADRVVVDERDSIEVPPDAPAYRLRRLWLSPEEVRGLLRGVRQQRVVAAGASGPRAAGAPRRGLGRVSERQPALRRSRSRRSAVGRDRRLHQRLPSRTGRQVSARPTAAAPHRDLLAHPVARPGSAADLPVAQGPPRGAALERPGRLSVAAGPAELPAGRRRRARGDGLRRDGLLWRPAGARRVGAHRRRLRPHRGDSRGPGAAGADGAAQTRAGARGQGRRRRGRSAGLYEGHPGAAGRRRSRAGRAARAGGPVRLRADWRSLAKRRAGLRGHCGRDRRRGDAPQREVRAAARSRRGRRRRTGRVASPAFARSDRPLSHARVSAADARRALSPRRLLRGVIAPRRDEPRRERVRGRARRLRRGADPQRARGRRAGADRRAHHQPVRRARLRASH